MAFTETALSTRTGRDRNRQPYLQWFKPTRTYRFRRPIPKRFWDVIGKHEFTETLSPDPGEARRLIQPHVVETDRILALAQAGQWPEITDEEIEAVAIGWWAQWRDDREHAFWLPGRPDHLQRALRNIHPTEWALANEVELRHSVEQFIRGPRRLDAIFEPELGLIRRLLDDPKRAAGLLRNSSATNRLLRDCRLYHHALAGAWGDALRLRENTLNRVEAALGEEKIAAAQIDAVIEGRPVAVTPANPVGYYPPISLGHVAAEDGSDLISKWAKEAEIGERGIYQTRLDMAKFVKLIGHDDATRVTPLDVVRFKEMFVDRGLSGATVNRYLSAIKSPLTWAKPNHKIATNPAEGVKYEAKGNARPKVKRIGYDDHQARTVLLAARDEDPPHRRWIPWVCAFTGCRLDEIAGRNARDIRRIGSIWVLDILTAKNEGSIRKIPLHPKLIAEGFIDYVKSLPSDGPLFPDLTVGKYGRAGTATKSIGRWLRQVQKELGVLLVEEPRLAPNHSWRHRFKSETRRARIPEEVHDALTGHTEGKVSREYGDYYIREVLCPAIEAMLSPFDIPEEHDREHASDQSDAVTPVQPPH
jgi:integrase